jgi:hypothetical protein
VKRPATFQVAPERRPERILRQNPSMASTDPTRDSNDQEVLGSLPTTRPQRRSAKRDTPARTRSTPRTAAAKADPAAERAAKPRAKPAPRAQARPAPPPPPPVPPAGYATPTAGGPNGTDMFMTAVLAAGELVRVGFVAWAQAVRAAVRHLPKP